MYRIEDIGAACDLDRNIQEISFSGNFILGNFLVGNFDTPGKVVAPKILPQIRLPPKFCSPGKNHRQDQRDQGELMVANCLPPNICLVRSCAPNICLYGAEELGERMFAWEGAVGRTFAWAFGAARSAATNKKKKKKKYSSPLIISHFCRACQVFLRKFYQKIFSKRVDFDNLFVV